MKAIKTPVASHARQQVPKRDDVHDILHAALAGFVLPELHVEHILDYMEQVS